MANTYTQLYVHIVFSVKGRQALIPERHKAELHKYITGIVSNKKQKLIQINSMPDHIHILVGITPDAALSGLVKDIKVNSTRFMNQKRWTVGQFAWQEGFGAFSYSHSQIPEVAANVKQRQILPRVGKIWVSTPQKPHLPGLGPTGFGIRALITQFIY